MSMIVKSNLVDVDVALGDDADLRSSGRCCLSSARATSSVFGRVRWMVRRPSAKSPCRWRSPATCVGQCSSGTLHSGNLSQWHAATGVRLVLPDQRQAPADGTSRGGRDGPCCNAPSSRHPLLVTAPLGAVAVERLHPRVPDNQRLLEPANSEA